MDFGKNDTFSILFYEALNVWARGVLLRLLIERKVGNSTVGECMRFGKVCVGSF